MYNNGVIANWLISTAVEKIVVAILGCVSDKV